MQLHALSLRFSGKDRSLESAYLQDCFTRNLGYLRLCHLFSLLAFSMAGIVDYALFPDQYRLAWTIRLSSGVPLFLLGLALTYTPLYERIWQGLSVLYVLTTGLASLLILLLMPPPDSYLYFVHIIICSMFGFIFARIHFLLSSLASIILYLSYTLTMILLVHPPQAISYNANLTMLILLIMGMFFSYGYEYTDRGDFYLRYLVEQEREKTASLNRSLEGRVKERTEELEREIAEHLRAENAKKELEKKLSQSQRMEAIGTLAGGIAHDFNNILTSVIGYGELAKLECEGNQALSDYLDQVLIAANRAGDLVRQILTFSRQTEQESKPVLLTPIVKEVIKLMRASLPSTITIESRVEQDVAVLADHTQIHQVLMNLCTNAWHAMRKHGGALSIVLEKVQLTKPCMIGHQDIEPGDWVRLTVRDTGCGIPPAIIERIFEPFFTTKEQSEGTGMGLAVVHGIVVGHGGAIQVDSTVGQGTTFDIYLPAIKLAVAEKTKPARPIRGGSETILIIDDEATLVSMMTDVLSRLGYTVQGRTSSLDGLELFRAASDRFDLVITDLTMPNLCGDQLAREITAIRKLPVILCTGFSVNLTEESVVKFGITAVLEKPVLPWQLAEKVRQVLDQSGARFSGA